MGKTVDDYDADDAVCHFREERKKNSLFNFKHITPQKNA
jgi:hypothetical protein